MSDRTSFKVSLYSHRQGNKDVYEFQVGRDVMYVAMGSKHAMCSWVDGGDPIWSGYNQNIGNPLVEMLENDSIYPPSIFVRALECAWKAWRDRELDDTQIESKVKELCNWLNKVSRSQPATDFWSRCF